MAERRDPKPDFRWPIAVAHTIAAPTDKVWATISMPGNLEFCHPFCARNPVLAWPGSDSRDEVHYLSGWVFERRFRRWIDGIGYDLEIGRAGGEFSFVSWRILPADDQNSILQIVVYPRVLQKLPAAVRWVPHITFLRPRLRHYLTSVVRGFEWYIVRGEAVPRNKFGTHPWFSAAKSDAQAA